MAEMKDSSIFTRFSVEKGHAMKYRFSIGRAVSRDAN